uniref:AB hydrolase-1 domain-containing protein n=1 Tax=Mola mola TaxID=94237 RepID=A0A3Q3W3P1_MOLML
MWWVQFCDEDKTQHSVIHFSVLQYRRYGPVSELSVLVPWGEIRGKVRGPDHGHPVLCLHGWADNCGTFDTLIPLLPKECRFVAVDLAGHGLSSHRPPGVCYSFPAYVADLRRVVDALQLKTFSIIGHSMGECGFTSGLFSLYPEMVDALVLLDSFGLLPTDSVRSILRPHITKYDKKRVYTFEKAVERLLAANPTLSEQSVHILLERGLIQVEGGFVFSRDLRVNFVKAFDSAASAVKVSFHLCRFQHPVVTVPGDHHAHLNTPEVVASFVSNFLQAKTESFKGSSSTVCTK